MKSSFFPQENDINLHHTATQPLHTGLVHLGSMVVYNTFTYTQSVELRHELTSLSIVNVFQMELSFSVYLFVCLLRFHNFDKFQR